MPFTTPESRRITDSVGPQVRGDFAFLHYRPLIRAWRKSMRWTTADELLADLIPDPDKRAKALAYAVFFCLHVLPYEILKRTENGEVE